MRDRHRKFNDPQEAALYLKQQVSLTAIAEHYGVEVIDSTPPYQKAVCPFHPDNDPSLSIHSERHLFVCFGCHAGGDSIEFVKLMESTTFTDALHLIAEIGGVDLSPYLRDPTREEIEQSRLHAILADIDGIAALGTDHPRFLDFLKRRRLDPAVVDAYRLGYIPDLSVLRGIKSKNDVGVYGALFEDSIVVPLQDEYGRTVAYRNRPQKGSIKTRGPKADHPLTIPPLYGFPQARKAIREQGHLILVEGEVDCWQMWSRGFEATCATMGSNLSVDTLKWIGERGIETIILMPDGDHAGYEFAMRVGRQKNPTRIVIKIAMLEEGDPDEVLLSDPLEVVSAIKNAKHASHFAIDEIIRQYNPKTPTGKGDILKESEEIVQAAIGVNREIVVEYLASVLHVSVEACSDYFKEKASTTELSDGRSESEILSLMLDDERDVGEALLGLNTEDFYYSRHRKLFQVMGDLYRGKHPITPETVRVSYNDDRFLERILDLRPSRTSLGLLVKKVRDLSVRRRVIDRMERVKNELSSLDYDARDSSLDLISQVTRVVVGRSDDVEDSDVLVDSVMNTMHERMDDPRLIIGADLGANWNTLNRSIHGLQSSRYVVVAAPSGVGKTMIAADWVRRIGVELEIPTFVLTFETGKIPYTQRIICNMANVPIASVATGMLNEEAQDLIHDAAAKLAKAPISITERGRNLEEAMALIRHDRIRRDTGFLVMDYIQLMKMTQRPRGMARHDELGEISRMCLEMAHEMDSRCLALAQINREGAKRARSSKEDIGGSFLIAQDSDILIIADEKTEAEKRIDGEQAGNRYGYIAKNRLDGPSDIGFSMNADTHTQRIWEVSGERRQSEADRIPNRTTVRG